MRKVIILLVFVFTASISFGAEEDHPRAKAIRHKITEVDFEVSLAQYREVKMSLFQTRMQLRLMDTEKIRESEEERKEERDRLEKRSAILQVMLDEIRAHVEELGKQISVAVR